MLADDQTFPTWSGDLGQLARHDFRGFPPEETICSPFLEFDDRGTVTIRIAGFVTASGWATIRRQIKQLSKAAHIAGIMLVINSQAQQVEGARSCIDQLAKAVKRGRCPIHAHISGDTRGIIYLLARECTRLVAAPEVTIGQGETGQPFVSTEEF